MKEIIDFYNQMSAGFEEVLQERTPEEITYDEIVLKELKIGRNIKRALKIANRECPDEALQFDEENINDIASHYDYLLNHELIKSRIKQISN